MQAAPILCYVLQRRHFVASYAISRGVARWKVSLKKIQDGFVTSDNILDKNQRSFT